MSLIKQDKIVRNKLLTLIPGNIMYIPYEFNGNHGALRCSADYRNNYVRIETGIQLNLLDNFSDGLVIYFDPINLTFSDDGYTFYNLQCVGIDICTSNEQLMSKSLYDLLLIIQRLYGKQLGENLNAE